MTADVKRLIQRLIAKGDWVDASQGFRGCEGALQLTGWSRSRRVVVLKRPIRGESLLTDGQFNLAFLDTEDGFRSMNTRSW